MKNSNKLLLLTLVALLTGVISFAFYVKPHVRSTKYTPLGNNPLTPGSVSVEKGILTDTLQGEFHYLWTNFPGVWLDTKSEDKIITFESRAGWEGYTFGKVELTIERDTLFIHHNLALMTQTTADDTTKVWHSVLVSANQLKGIEVVGEGWVANVHRTARVVASPSEQKAALTTNSDRYPGDHAFNEPLSPLSRSLELNFKNGGMMDLNLEVDELSVKVTGNQDGYRFSDLWLWGHCQRLEIDHQYARFTTRAFPLEADSVFIYAEDYRTRSNATIRVRAKEYLNAEINGWADVLYLGAPRVEKQEFYGGRVVDANRYQ